MPSVPSLCFNNAWKWNGKSSAPWVSVLWQEIMKSLIPTTGKLCLPGPRWGLKGCSLMQGLSRTSVAPLRAAFPVLIWAADLDLEGSRSTSTYESTMASVSPPHSKWENFYFLTLSKTPANPFLCPLHRPLIVTPLSRFPFPFLPWYTWDLSPNHLHGWHLRLAHSQELVSVWQAAGEINLLPPPDKALSE